MLKQNQVIYMLRSGHMLVSASASQWNAGDSTVLVSNPQRKTENKQRFWRLTWFSGLTKKNNPLGKPEKPITCSYMENKTSQTLCLWETQTAHPASHRVCFPAFFPTAQWHVPPGWYSSSAIPQLWIWLFKAVPSLVISSNTTLVWNDWNVQ